MTERKITKQLNANVGGACGNKTLKRYGSMYVLMFALWMCLSFFFVAVVAREYAYSDSVLINVLLTLNAMFILYFWLNGTKDVVYVLWYYAFRDRLAKFDKVIHKKKPVEGAKVSLLYCTCNDFNGVALEKCMHQDYPGCKYVILDDSKKPEYIQMIDEFAREHPEVEMVRRVEHTGFKAGNLNNYLKNRKDEYDYFAILDSDEIVPDTFVTDCLKFFNYYSNVGIVQCNHKSVNNVNAFMNLFHIGVDSHWPTYQTVKHHNGFMSLLGHGAIISRECVENAGFFDEVVAEDLVFCIKARNAGYLCAFNVSTVCEEEYPIDYLAFKKRHNKWTQGNMEFIKRYTVPILKSNMRWFEKMDIFLFTYNLPLTAFFTLYILINVSVLPLLGYKLHYPVWLIVPTIVFFIAPMANDFITYTFTSKKLPLHHVLYYMFSTFVLYGSMFWVSLKSSFMGMLPKTKAKFLVTPKDTHKITFTEAIKFNKDELMFAVVLTAISVTCSHSILPVLLIVLPSVLCVWLTVMSNEKTEVKTKETTKAAAEEDDLAETISNLVLPMRNGYAKYR